MLFPTLLITGLVLLAILVPVLLSHRATSRRQQTLARMLDLADEVENLLDRSQERMPNRCTRARRCS